MDTITTRGAGGFVRLALATAALTLGLIVFGAVVRVTDSGLGCGNEWPLCNGSIIPPLDNLTAWIEWLHRLFAVLIGLFGLVTLAVAWRGYRQANRMVLNLVLASAGLFLVQSTLGALVVVLDLPPTFVTLHLGVAMLLLGGLLAAALVAVYQPSRTYAPDGVTTLIYINTALSLVIILTGALVRGSGATLACTEWPSCINSNWLPTEYGQLALVHMTHRFAVGALGLTLLMMAWQVARQRDSIARGLAIGACVVYGLQAGVGALYVLTAARAEWGAAHVGLAATTWGFLVALSIVEALSNGQIASRVQSSWNPHSETISQASSAS